jgi:hypothetical protein
MIISDGTIAVVIAVIWLTILIICTIIWFDP